MPRDGSAAAALENPQPLIQVRRQPRNPEHVDLRSGKLDRQSHAVQTPADLADNGCFRVAQLIFQSRRRRPLNEELDSRIAQCLGRGQILHVGRTSQRRQASYRFTQHPQ